jgi:hypothetical protein
MAATRIGTGGSAPGTVAGRGVVAVGSQELPEPGDRALVRDAEPGLGEVLGADREAEVVAAPGGCLGREGLTGGEQGVAAEDGDRGGAYLESGHLAADEGGQRGRVVPEGLPEPHGAQSGVAGVPGAHAVAVPEAAVASPPWTSFRR